MTEVGPVVYEDIETERSSISMRQNVSYEKTTNFTSQGQVGDSSVGNQVSLGSRIPSNDSAPIETKSKTRWIAAAVLVWELFLVVLVLLALAMTAWALRTTGRCEAENSGKRTLQDLNITSQAQLEAINDLKSTVLALQTQLEVLQNSSFTVPPRTESTTYVPTTQPSDEATPTQMTIPSSSSILEKDLSITLNNVSLFMDCTTSIERTCTIMTTQTACTTGFGATYQRPGEFIMDISCIRQTPAAADQNGMSWVLSIDSTNNEVECLCYVVTPVTGANPTRRVETCGLRVTRCRTFSNITVNATLTSL